MHKQFLRAALEQAWLGRGLCAPNPSVGAVAVRDGKIIAQAWHHGAGTAHAEKLVIEMLAGNGNETTLYVTLEPCNHWGKTPPCVNEIINSGIQRVVYAYRDPNPVVAANNTPILLLQKGIEVIYQPIPEIDEFYRSYRHWTISHKPWLTVKMAQSFDGKIAGINGKRTMLSNELCAQFTHQQRNYSDIILSTASTINMDDPLLNVRINGTETAKPLAIIDSKNRLNPHSKVLSTAQHCHIYHDQNSPPVTNYPNCSYHPMPAAAGGIDLQAVITHLGGLGYHDVWVEAGARLFAALHQAQLVHQTYLYLVPMCLGEQATALYQGDDIFKQAHTISWQQMGNNMIASLAWLEVKESACSPV